MKNIQNKTKLDLAIKIRKETSADYRTVEEVTREAFWNLYVPGCEEHYLVHTMRSCEDFLPEYAFVAEHEGKIVGNIMSMRSKLIGTDERTLNTITFGPVSVLPEHQHKGVGAALINKTISQAKSDRYPALIILGSPHNYCKYGFKSSKDYHVSNPSGKFPFGQLILELAPGSLAGTNWKFFTSIAYELDPDEVDEFDKEFSEKKKEYQPCQEEYSIGIRSFTI